MIKFIYKKFLYEKISENKFSNVTFLFENWEKFRSIGYIVQFLFNKKIIPWVNENQFNNLGEINLNKFDVTFLQRSYDFEMYSDSFI